jgi:hypothetical protein
MKESLEPATPAIYICVRPDRDPSYLPLHGRRLP